MQEASGMSNLNNTKAYKLHRIVGGPCLEILVCHSRLQAAPRLLQGKQKITWTIKWGSQNLGYLQGALVTLVTVLWGPYWGPSSYESS